MSHQVIPDIRISIDLHQEGRDARGYSNGTRTLLDWANALKAFGSGRSDIRVEVDTSGVGRVTLNALRREGVTCEEMAKQNSTVEVPAAREQLDWIAGRIADETLTDRELRETLAKGLGVITRRSWTTVPVGSEPVANSHIVTHGELRVILAALRDEMSATLAKARSEQVLHDFSNVTKRLNEQETTLRHHATRLDTLSERLLKQERKPERDYSGKFVEIDQKLADRNVPNRLAAVEQRLGTSALYQPLDKQVRELREQVATLAPPTGMKALALHEVERRVTNLEQCRTGPGQLVPDLVRAVDVLDSKVADLARPLATARIATIDRRVEWLADHVGAGGAMRRAVPA